MMRKYIIKNCPILSTSYYRTGEILHNQCGLHNEQLCNNIPNCLLKQIADKLNNFFDDMVGKNLDEEKKHEIITRKICDIYDMLDIEECENE